MNDISNKLLTSISLFYCLFLSKLANKRYDHCFAFLSFPFPTFTQSKIFRIPYPKNLLKECWPLTGNFIQIMASSLLQILNTSLTREKVIGVSLRSCLLVNYMILVEVILWMIRVWLKLMLPSVGLLITGLMIQRRRLVMLDLKIKELLVTWTLSSKLFTISLISERLDNFMYLFHWYW